MYGETRTCTWVFKNKLRCNRHFMQCPETCDVCNSSLFERLFNTEFGPGDDSEAEFDAEASYYGYETEKTYYNQTFYDDDDEGYY
jgi:hypothetical protein